MARMTIWGAALAAALLTRGVLATDVLKTSGFTNCEAGSSIQVNNVNIEYSKTSETVTFDVSGTSTKQQKVMASLNVTAYGIVVYSNTFNPCDNGTYVEQLCPVPAGSFSASGTQDISASYASQIPAIAFQVPDIAATATLELIDVDTNDDTGCITSDISNGKTTNVAAVTYVAAAIAGAALVMGGVTAASSALGAGAGAGGGAAPSPSFFEVFSWFQGMAMNGMSSVSLPQVYRSFSKNFGFSMGLIPWARMQISIDNFREATGGNLTLDSVQFLENATLVFTDGSTETLGDSSKFKRAMDHFTFLASRGVTGSVNETESTANSTVQNFQTEVRVAVSGIKAFSEELSIPSANTFMTVLLFVAIVIASIAVIILLVKVILEAWALFASFPKSLTGFRKHYWFTMGRTITQLILLLYGTWVLYCIFQFTNGDSWAAVTLAGVTLALFTGVLAFFAYKIFATAKKLKEVDGDASQLYENKDIWIRYSLFYENYKKDYWWLFVPTITYMFAKGCILAAGDNHGLAQTIGQLIVEALMLGVLIWSRPYERKSGNVINIMIAVVRVLSVICILIFVDEFAISETTTTVTGVVLIAIQAALTGCLALLIVWNSIIAICNQNPHRKRRKEMEKMRDLDDLTPLDARNSLLLDRKSSHADSDNFSVAKTKFDVKETYDHDQSHDGLVNHAAPPGGYDDRSASPAPYADTSNMYARAPYNPQSGYGAPAGGGGHHNGYGNGY